LRDTCKILTSTFLCSGIGQALKNFFSSSTRIITPINNKSKNNNSSFITQQNKFTKLHIINLVEYIQILLLLLSHFSVWAFFRQTIVSALAAEKSFHQTSKLQTIVSALNAEAGRPSLLQVHSLILSHLNMENREKIADFRETKLAAKVTNEKR
jgi:hypothetical protein